jgi:hypothetical protein
MTQSTNCAIFFVRLLYLIIELSITTCFDPQGIIFRDETCRNTEVYEKTLGILLVECCEVAIRVLPNLICLGLKLLFFKSECYPVALEMYSGNEAINKTDNLSSTTKDAPLGQTEVIGAVITVLPLFLIWTLPIFQQRQDAQCVVVRFHVVSPCLSVLSNIRL